MLRTGISVTHLLSTLQEKPHSYLNYITFGIYKNFIKNHKKYIFETGLCSPNILSGFFLNEYKHLHINKPHHKRVSSIIFFLLVFSKKFIFDFDWFGHDCVNENFY